MRCLYLRGQKMRCPNCKKLLPYAAKENNASNRCIFCEHVFGAVELAASKMPVRSSAEKAGVSLAAPSGHRPRLINSRYALGPSPRSGGMALVYKANDMFDDNRL